MVIIKGPDENFPPSFRKITRSPLIKKDQIQDFESEEPAHEEFIMDEAVKIPASDEEAKKMHEPSKQAEVGAPEVPPVEAEALLNKARQRAAEILEEAEEKKREALKLIKESQIYCGSAYSQSEKDGFNTGKEEGFKKIQFETASHVKEAKDILEQAIKEREVLIRSAEPEVAKLAIEIAEKIMARELKTDPEAVLGIVQAAMSKIKGTREHVAIKVSPEDYEVVLKNKPVYEKMAEGVKSFEVVSDNKLDSGNCVIETNLGNVVATIKTQLETLRIAFEGVSDYDQESA